jgi:hypothetical protein
MLLIYYIRRKNVECHLKQNIKTSTKSYSHVLIDNKFIYRPNINPIQKEPKITKGPKATVQNIDDEDQVETENAEGPAATLQNIDDEDQVETEDAEGPAATLQNIDAEDHEREKKKSHKTKKKKKDSTVKKIAKSKNRKFMVDKRNLLAFAEKFHLTKLKRKRKLQKISDSSSEISEFSTPFTMKRRGMESEEEEKEGEKIKKKKKKRIRTRMCDEDLLASGSTSGVELSTDEDIHGNDTSLTDYQTSEGEAEDDDHKSKDDEEDNTDEEETQGEEDDEVQIIEERESEDNFQETDDADMDSEYNFENDQFETEETMKEKTTDVPKKITTRWEHKKNLTMRRKTNKKWIDKLSSKTSISGKRTTLLWWKGILICFFMTVY